MDKKIQYDLILGSKSPRRQELLKNGGYDFKVRVQDIDESFPETLPKIEVAEYLSLKKAESLRSTLHQQELLLTADSVVIVNDLILNKPSDYEEAQHMLSLLSGQWHVVATGVCLTSTKSQKSFTSVTKVKFDPLTQKEIDYYIEHYAPFDKAGGYGIQDWIGLCKVSEIAGSYSNVMGLPMREVYQELLQFP